MKTIILCGGRGMRLNEETEYKPKPMIQIGDWPVLVHIMNIYAKYGYKDFVLALGYKGHMIRDYFINLPLHLGDVQLNMSTGSLTPLYHKRQLDFNITFVDTGANADTAERVLKASRLIDDQEFMVSYGDDLSDINIDKIYKFHQRQLRLHKTQATITAAHPSSHYGQIWADKRDVIRKFQEKPMMNDYVNGGFMVFTKTALKHLKRGETLEDGLERMASHNKLSQYRHEGFWHPMNTMKDVQYLNQLWKKGRPWTK